MSKDFTADVRAKYEQKADGYDKMMAPMERMMMAKWRMELCSRARGLVLEAGVGTGANLTYYKNVDKVIGVDFSPTMLEYARKRAEQAQVPIELMEEDIEDLPFADDTFDTVITACVFCSVPDAVQGFKELNRVIKPEGRLYFLEHVRSKGFVLGPMMDLINPLTVKMSGVNINRRTEETIAKAGLRIVKVDNLFGDIVKLITAARNNTEPGTNSK